MSEKPVVLASIWPIEHRCNLPGHSPIVWKYDEAHAEEHERQVAEHRLAHRQERKKP